MVTLTCGSGAVAGSGMVGTVYDGHCRGKVSFVLTLVTEAVRCEVVSTHIQVNTNRSRHIVTKYETQPPSLLLFCSRDRI